MDIEVYWCQESGLWGVATDGSNVGGAFFHYKWQAKQHAINVQAENPGSTLTIKTKRDL